MPFSVCMHWLQQLCSNKPVVQLDIMLDEGAWRVQETADYFCSRQFSVVTLQFPDEQLQHAARVANAVHTACSTRGHVVQVLLISCCCGAFSGWQQFLTC